MGIQNSNRAGNGSAIELDKILLSLVQVTELHVKDFPPPFCLGNPVLLGYRFVVAVGGAKGDVLSHDGHQERS